MVSLAALRDLYAHMEWADAKVWQAVLALDRGPVDERLRGRLLHIHVVQRAFLHVWTSQPVIFPEPGEFPSLPELEAWARPYYDETRRFFGGLTETRLDEPIHMPWVKLFEQQLGRPLETPTLADTMFQVPSHSTYHRGQVNTIVRELGGEPPLVDYIAWVWFGRPNPDWAAG